MNYLELSLVVMSLMAIDSLISVGLYHWLAKDIV